MRGKQYPNRRKMPSKSQRKGRCSQKALMDSPTDHSHVLLSSDLASSDHGLPHETMEFDDLFSADVTTGDYTALMENEARSLLKKPPEARSEADLRAISCWIKRQPAAIQRYFAFADADSRPLPETGLTRMQTLCMHAKLVTVPVSTLLFKQGEAAGNFYIISQGACDVFHAPQQDLKPVDISRASLASGTLQREDLGVFVGRLRAGECLGELPNLFSYKRSASVVTCPAEDGGATHLLQFDQVIYDALVAPVFKTALDSLLERAKFLRKLAVFSHWPAHEALFLANWTFVDKKCAGTHLWSCGDPVANVQFVQSGAVDIKVLEPAVSLYQEFAVETVFAAGMLLATDAYSRTKQRCNTAVCTTDVSLLTIPAALFSRMVAMNTNSGAPFQLQSKQIIFKYAEFQRTWHSLRITDCEDPTTFKMGYSLVHIVQNRFLPCGWCGDKGHAQADCHLLMDDDFSSKVAKLALGSSSNELVPAVVPTKDDSQRPTRTRRRVASVVGEDWLDNPNRVHAIMSPHSQAVQCTREVKLELLTLRRAVWAFKRLLRRSKARKAAKVEAPTIPTATLKSPSSRRRSLNRMSSHGSQVASLMLPLTGPSPSNNGRISPGRVEETVSGTLFIRQRPPSLKTLNGPDPTLAKPLPPLSSTGSAGRSKRLSVMSSYHKSLRSLESTKSGPRVGTPTPKDAEGDIENSAPKSLATTFSFIERPAVIEGTSPKAAIGASDQSPSPSNRAPLLRELFPQSSFRHYLAPEVTELDVFEDGVTVNIRDSDSPIMTTFRSSKRDLLRMKPWTLQSSDTGSQKSLIPRPQASEGKADEFDRPSRRISQVTARQTSGSKLVRDSSGLLISPIQPNRRLTTHN